MQVKRNKREGKKKDGHRKYLILALYRFCVMMKNESSEKSIGEGGGERKYLTFALYGFI